MRDPDLTSERASAAPSDGHPDAPLLTRLNARGLRLVQVADIVVIYAIAVGIMLVLHGWAWPDYPKPLYLVSFTIAVAFFVTSLYFGGLYEREPRLGYPPVLPRAARQTLAAGGLFALFNLAATGAAHQLGWDTNRALPMPISNLAVLIALAAVGVAANRHVAHRLRYRREGPPRVLLVGGPDEVEVARAHLAEDSSRARVAGEASSVDGLTNAVAAQGITDVVLLSSQWLDSLYPDVLRELEGAGVAVLQRVTAKETMFGLERVREIGGMPFVLLRSQTMPGSRARFKRAWDLVVLCAGAVFVLPVLGAVALYVLAVAGRPVLFLQDRVGAGGRIFRLIKFRTMYPNAEEDGRPQLASREDPRIIPACAWLRATRLDELPQVVNILRGDMSLVGPRPERPELTAEFEQLIPGYGRRHEIPPGLTGLAQIHGRYHTDPEYKLGYDLQYLVNWSPVLDIEILLRTVWVVVTRRI